MARPHLSRLALAAIAVLAVTSFAAPAGAKKPPKDPKPQHLTSVRLLTINDLHGNLEPPTGSSGRIVDEAGNTVDAGGVAYLATYIKQRTVPNTALVAAGDLIGATPLISAAYHDEPTIDVLEHLGLLTTSVGNHEFDEGYAELLRIMQGGCHPTDGCSPAGPYDGASFDFLATNVLRKVDDSYALPPVFIQRFGKERVAFIGSVTQTTPSIVTSSGIVDLDFTEEVAATNRMSDLLSALGIHSQVMLVHEGDSVTPGQSPDACSAQPGNGTRIAQSVDPAIDVIVTGHSHQAYICTIPDPAGNPRVVTQGSSFGRVLTQIDFKIDKKTHDVVRSTVVADNHVVARTVTPDPEIQALVQTWRDRVASVANAPVGQITAELPPTAGPSGESPLGNLIADAQLAATAADGGAVIALMNPGGIRAGLTFASSPAGEGDGVVTYGEAFAVQPFNNLMQVVDLTGAALDDLLEQQFPGGPNNQPFAKILQPSAGLNYDLDNSADWGGKVSNIRINGVPVDPAATYRVAANNFLVGGGDGFTVFQTGTNRWSGLLDIDALVAYLEANSPVTAPATDRITVIG